MQISEPKRPRTKRHELWSLGTLKEDLQKKDTTLTNICKRYAETPDNWRALYGDVCRWRRSDQELDQLILDNSKATDPQKRETYGGGRPSKDSEPEFADWRSLFCQELLRTSSRVLASEVTPYKYEEIHKKLNDNYAEYDKQFAEMVHLTEMRQLAEAEQTIWTSLREAQSPKDKAWIAERILKARDRMRWGDKLDVNVGGTIINRFEVNKQKLLAELSADQQRFFDKHPTKQLEAGDIVDAVVVEDVE